jgi:hypothetical protein
LIVGDGSSAEEPTVNENQTVTAAIGSRPGRIPADIRQHFDAELGIAGKPGLCVMILGHPPLAIEIATEVGFRAGHRIGVAVVNCASAHAEETLAGLCHQALASSRRPASGVLLLQEIQFLSPRAQALLAAALGSKRGGGIAATLIVSTSVPLFDLTMAGTFDQELFYRLNTICMDVAAAQNNGRTQQRLSPP